ncbi:hypothetical protein PENSPDRAFT_604659 [Peniophora sp. CONT]|nr:hypothetical protein PENSPDRAFT_604659 [Peniophora sp. CONT]
MNGYTELDVSLEPELLTSLDSILPLIPEDLASRLTSALESSPTPGKTRTIPYPLLLDLSKWTRTDSGREALSKKSLRETDYTMISLLAGTRTAPNRRFPLPPKPESDGRRELNDRRAITTVINSLLSVFGAGWAAWMAAGHVGWRDEWRIVLGLIVSSVVAVAELGLYLIWESRARPNDTPSATRPKPLQVTATRDKKVDDDAGTEAESKRHTDSSQLEGVSSAIVGRNLRQRPAPSSE